MNKRNLTDNEKELYLQKYFENKIFPVCCDTLVTSTFKMNKVTNVCDVFIFEYHLQYIKTTQELRPRTIKALHNDNETSFKSRIKKKLQTYYNIPEMDICFRILEPSLSYK